MADTELVIFDCDGVLINTEDLVIDIDVEVYRELGWTDVTRDAVVERFLGVSHDTTTAGLEELLGRTLEPEWHSAFADRYEDVLAREMVAMDGVMECFEALDVPFCVASSSRHEHLRKRLTQVGLFPHVEGNIYSAQDVERGKPFPDLFLYAADQMGGVDPSRCLVIEDSPAGVQAAIAAGMPVRAFARSIVPRERFPAHVPWLERMADLPELLLTGAAV